MVPLSPWCSRRGGPVAWWSRIDGPPGREKVVRKRRTTFAPGVLGSSSLDPGGLWGAGVQTVRPSASLAHPHQRRAAEQPVDAVESRAAAHCAPASPKKSPPIREPFTHRGSISGALAISQPPAILVKSRLVRSSPLPGPIKSTAGIFCPRKVRAEPGPAARFRRYRAAFAQ